jgi:hypothetical protein
VHLGRIGVLLEHVSASLDTLLGEPGTFGFVGGKFRKIEAGAGELPSGFEILGVVLILGLGLEKSGSCLCERVCLGPMGRVAQTNE